MHTKSNVYLPFYARILSNPMMKLAHLKVFCIRAATEVTWLGNILQNFWTNIGTKNSGKHSTWKRHGISPTIFEYVVSSSEKTELFDRYSLHVALYFVLVDCFFLLVARNFVIISRFFLLVARARLSLLFAQFP